MARTALTATQLKLDAGVDVKSATVGTAIDATNGHSLATDGRTQRYLFHIKNTFAGDKIVTFKAGNTNPPAQRSGLGDLAVTVVTTSGEQMVIVESDRFVNKDGTIYLDIAAGMTGSIAVYELPEPLR